mmetsp:Transcript_28255/g.87416  ORF Transcript_28255/g.87416 Transcript_28255/m.87416 type:complete len:213 (+) Transcript_28255:267-905(+)
MLAKEAHGLGLVVQDLVEFELAPHRLEDRLEPSRQARAAEQLVVDLLPAPADRGGRGRVALERLDDRPDAPARDHDVVRKVLERGMVPLDEGRHPPEDDRARAPDVVPVFGIRAREAAGQVQQVPVPRVVQDLGPRARDGVAGLQAAIEVADQAAAGRRRRRDDALASAVLFDARRVDEFGRVACRGERRDARVVAVGPEVAVRGLGGGTRI